MSAKQQIDPEVFKAEQAAIIAGVREKVGVLGAKIASHLVEAGVAFYRVSLLYPKAEKKAFETWRQDQWPGKGFGTLNDWQYAGAVAVAIGTSKVRATSWEALKYLHRYISGEVRGTDGYKAAQASLQAVWAEAVKLAESDKGPGASPTMEHVKAAVAADGRADAGTGPSAQTPEQKAQKRLEKAAKAAQAAGEMEVPTTVKLAEMEGTLTAVEDVISAAVRDFRIPRNAVCLLALRFLRLLDVHSAEQLRVAVAGGIDRESLSVLKAEADERKAAETPKAEETPKAQASDDVSKADEKKAEQAAKAATPKRTPRKRTPQKAATK